MKKVLGLSPSKVLLLCGLGLLVTLGSFWHHQNSQSQLDRMGVLNQGVGTCFNRISQTFTAMMIKDVRSPYLGRGFMGLSDECLNETIKGINPFKRDVGRGYETLNKLISEVHWFHEKVTKIHAPMLAGQNLSESVAPLSERYTKMETLKLTLVDEIDGASVKIRGIQASDEVLMGVGLLLFVIGLSVLSLQEFNRIQLRREIEKEALNLLKAGQANVGAMVDAIVDRALLTQGMPVTTQIFKDYHGELLERLAGKAHTEVVEKKVEEVPEVQEVTPTLAPKSSLREVLVSLESVFSEEVLQVTDVRDVNVAVEYEAFEAMLNSALSKLVEKRLGNKKIMISNQIHSDRTIVSLFLAGNTFNVSELEYAEAGKNGPDMNIMILKEMAAETNSVCFLENKTDRSGAVTGMSIRLTLPRTAKERSKLVSVVRGKKRDLSREMVN